MAAKRFAVTLVLAVAGLIVGCVGVGAQESHIDDEFSRLEKLEQCVSDFEDLLRSKLAGSPEMASIAQAVEWVSGRLPGNLREALVRAGHREGDESGATSWSEVASDRSRFMTVIHRNLFRELSALSEYQEGGCALVLKEKFGNVLYRTLNLGSGDLGDAFGKIGLHDSYDIENAFLGMLMLYVAEVDYRDIWFSQ